MKFESIGMSCATGAAVGIINFKEEQIRWSPRQEGVFAPKSIAVVDILRASWTPMGKMCHLRLFCKGGEKIRFDGFKKSDIDQLSDTYFRKYDIEFDKEVISCGGGNYGTLSFEDAGSLSLNKDGCQIFELSLASVSQCLTPGHKQDELDIQFVDVDSSNREDQSLYSMRLWVPGQASEIQSQVLSKAVISSHTGDIIVEFDRDMGTFITPKIRFTVEMYETFMRVHGTTNEYRIQYSDISRFYMLEKPMGRKGASEEASFFYFVICLDKPIRQGQQKYPFLVWQTQNEETELAVNMEEAALEERYPGSGLKPTLQGALHKLIGKVFKVLTSKTVYAGSRKYRSADDNQCVSCSLGQRTGHLYPNDKSFVFLHQPTLVVEYSSVEYVEFVKAPGTRNFDLVVALKTEKGESGKKHKFGSIEKKEFNLIAEFLKEKESFFSVRNYEPEAAEDEEDNDEEDDEDFNSDDGSEAESSGDDDDDEEDDADAETPASKVSSLKTSVSPKARKPAATKPVVTKKVESQAKRKKDANAPKAARSAYQLWSNHMRAQKEFTSDKNFSELTKELGAKWKELDPDEKSKWQERAASDKERHSSEMQDYEPSHDEPSKKKARAQKDPNAPKKPMGAFFLFTGKERDKFKAENPSASIGDIGKALGAKWKALSDEEKAPFVEKAAEHKQAYDAALAKYKKGASADVAEDDAESEPEDLEGGGESSGE